MNTKATINAFVGRDCPPNRRFLYAVYSAALALATLLLSYWIVSSGVDSQAARFRYESIHEYDGRYLPEVLHRWSLTVSQVLELASILSLFALMIGAFVVAPSLVTAQLANERQKGTLEQLRASPNSARQLLLGFALGAPTRIALLLAGPWVLFFFGGIFGSMSLWALLLSTLVLLVGSAASVVFAMALSLLPQKQFGGAPLALLTTAILGLAGLLAVVMAGDGDSIRWAFLHPAGALQSLLLSPDGMAKHLFMNSWDADRYQLSYVKIALFANPFASLFISLSGMAILGRAATSRLARPDEPALTSPLAFGLFALASSALLLPLSNARAWGFPARWFDELLPMAALLFPLMALLVVTTQPDARLAGYRLRRSGRLLVPWRLAAGMCGAFLVLAVISLAIRSTSLGLSFLFHPRAIVFALWLGVTAAFIAVYYQFVTIRFANAAHRVLLYGVGIAHIWMQLVCMRIPFRYVGGMGHFWLKLSVLLALSLPALTLWRLVSLRKRILAPVDGATTRPGEGR